MEFIPVNFTAHNRHTWLSFAKRIRILSIKVRRWERSKKVTISKFQFGISRRHLEFEQNWASLFLLGLRSTNSESLRKIGLLGLKGLILLIKAFLAKWTQSNETYYSHTKFVPKYASCKFLPPDGGTTKKNF